MRLLSGDARRAVFSPLDDGAGRSEAVVRRLGSAIALGIIVDGEQLPSEAQLAAALNVSTVTLRDALSELRARGLLTTRRGRGGGSFVNASEAAITELSLSRLRQIGSTELRELGDHRAAIAGTAARLAAERATSGEIGRLRDILSRLADTPGGTEQRRIESRYYIDVAATAQSVRLTMQEIELQAELGQLLWGTPRNAVELAAAVDSHRLVVDAIEARDAASARRVTETHIARVTAQLIDVHVTLTRGRRPARLPVPALPPPAAEARS
jgi:DNA-binding FadR family transcriptional regulator